MVHQRPPVVQRKPVTREQPLLLHSYQVQVQGQAKLICGDRNQCQVLLAGKGAEGDLAGYGEAPYVPPCTGWGVTQVYTVSQSVCWSLLSMSCSIATLVN